MKRKILTILAIISILATILFVLTGCESKNDSGENKEKSDNKKTSSVTEQDYYNYIKEKLIPEYGLASTDVINIPMTYSGYDDGYFKAKDSRGIIGCKILDIDGDSDLEMIVIVNSSSSLMDSIYKDLLYDEGAAYDAEHRTLIYMFYVYDYYSNSNRIYESNYGYMGYLPCNDWGEIISGIVEIDKTYYLVSYTETQDMSSYGPKYMTVFKLEKNSENRGRIAPCFVSPWSSYDLSEEETYELFHASPSLDISETCLDQMLEKLYKTYENDETIFDDSLLCWTNVTPETYGGTLLYQNNDNTNLREHLDNN